VVLVIIHVKNSFLDLIKNKNLMQISVIYSKEKVLVKINFFLKAKTINF
jgi:hypothetical protein